MTTALRDDPQLDELTRRLGRLIEAERKRAGMTQEDVAGRLGVSQNAVTGWEKAARGGALHLSVILALEQLFGLPQGTMLQRLGLMPSTPDFEAVVLSNLLLEPEQKEALIGVYRAMI